MELVQVVGVEVISTKLNWPYVYILSDGYACRMPTFDSAFDGMKYEMRAQKQCAGTIYKERKYSYMDDGVVKEGTTRKVVAQVYINFEEINS